MKKIKILFVHQNLEIGGAETLRKYVLSSIDRERYCPEICCIEGRGAIGGELHDAGHRVREIGKKITLLNSPVIVWRLYNLIRRNRYDVVHASLFYANFFARIAGILTKTPLLIIEEHGIYKWKDRKPLFVWADRILSRFTHKIICCSDSVRDFTLTQERVAEKKFMVIKNCLDFDSFAILESKGAIRKTHSLNPAETIIGVVGVLREEKGHLYLVEAVNILSKKHKNIRLLVIGDGLLCDTLKKLVNRLGIDKRVSFLGWRLDIPRLLKAMDIFVLPSTSEGLGISLLEAMYSEVPVVATNVGGIPEIIQDGVNGLLVPPRNSALLAEAIERLILDREYATKLATKGREIVVKDFSAPKYTAAIENIYANFFGEQGV